MKHIRLALLIIAGALLLFAIVVTHFAINTRHPSPNIGAAYLAVWILAGGGALTAAGLFTGGALGTLALVRYPDTRRPLYVFVILCTWMAALVLGWWGWEFWSHSALPKVPA